ncbi:MAG: hypothetical protein NC230_04385 [Bacteroides sp.]|nr:hypothetical protein [Bacteroides sp.]
MQDITSIFIDYLTQYGSADIAESEFKKEIHVDSELHDAYRQWCDEVGSSEKNGFFDFVDEYYESENDKWNTLNDYDDEV